MIINGHNPSDLSDKMQKESQDYVEALEEELRKIRVFRRELPLCLEIVTQAIETCKQQLSGTTTAEYNYLHGQFECNSEQTSGDVPVFEEFIPLKRASSRHSDGEEEESRKQRNEISDGGDCKKSDWLKSVQLWNQTPDPLSIEDLARKVSVVEVKGNGGGGAFHPFDRGGNVDGGGTPTAPMQEPMSSSVPPASTSSTAETGGEIKKAEKELQSERKARRCWSPELHRRFLEALQQLGGSHAATPKQIKELMKADGLTNDEIKSHLQKYRLHARRQNLSIRNNSNNNNPQSPQFVVVGGIWAPPACAAAVATTTTSGEATGVATPKGICAPVATLPYPPPFQDASTSLKQRQEKEPSHSDDRGSRGEGGVQSHFSAASSSTQTTTVSLAFGF